MKYKLIKEYPGSPKLGIIVTYEGIKYNDSMYEMTFLYSVRPGDGVRSGKTNPSQTKLPS